MSEIYNKEYYENYDVGVGKVNYIDSEYTKDFLTKVAKQIVEDLQPKVVLDAGCAMGHLVAALRDLGVEAYGMDISQYAIEHVREDIRPFCAAQSLTEPFPETFPKKFDLILSIEVLEHLYEEDCEKAIANLCSHTDSFILSSTADDTEEITHLNVRQPEYWAKQFAKQGLYDNVDYKPAYISPVSMMFVRTDNLPRLVENYERHLRIQTLEKEKAQQQYQVRVEESVRDAKLADERHQQEKKALETRLAAYAQELSANGRLSENHKRLQESYQNLLQHTQQIEAERNQYIAIANSGMWKLTKPLRMMLNLVKKGLRGFKLIGKGIKSVFKIGPKATWTKVRHRSSAINDFKAYMKKHTLSEAELNNQRSYEVKNKILMSVVVPLYNTPDKFLQELIESLQAQTYPYWELCLADGSDDKHIAVNVLCKRYAQQDDRIVYKKLEKNEGIAGNTNAALRMAQGEYIVLLDHDDILPPNALFECYMAIEKQQADFIYSDEMVFEGTPENVQLIHFKPSFSPDTLRGHNYICHLCAFSAELQKKVGFFSNEHDGSQDYDMVLRLTEQAKRIVHIPKVLYYWRMHAGSVASDVSVKPYCMESAKKAISDQLDRLGLKGTVTDSSILSTYKVNYDIQGEPLVSILIPNKDHIHDLEGCVTSILNASTYKNFEIIVIENNSNDSKTFDYYESLKMRDERIRLVQYEGEFNYSKINNYGAKFAKGEYLLLLNNDMEIITPSWIEEMLMFVQRKDVGAAGALLYYSDNTVQHAGLIMGIGGSAAHAHRHAVRNSGGYIHRLSIAQNMSGVTGACLMVKRSVWNELGGLDEKFAVAFNDVDFCLRIRDAGYLIVFTPYAELYHYESKSRGYENTQAKQVRFARERQLLRERWGKVIDRGDPYYNPNLTLDREDFSLK